MAGKSDEEVRVAAERVMQELAVHEEEARGRGERFERIDEQTLRRRLAGDAAESPFFSSLSSSGGAPPGGTANITVRIFNPDPVPYSAFALFGYLFFGSANSIQSTDLSLTAVDTRFPRYWRGLGVAAGGSASALFSFAVPRGITPGVYFGNCYLVRRDSFDVGQVFDRSSVDFNVL
jgi:hypothetical protein